MRFLQVVLDSAGIEIKKMDKEFIKTKKSDSDFRAIFHRFRVYFGFIFGAKMAKKSKKNLLKF